jgi:hypothetical protein
MHVKREGEGGLVLKRLRFSGGVLAVVALVATMVAAAAYGISTKIIGGQLGEVQCVTQNGSGQTPSGKACSAGGALDSPTAVALMDDGSRIFVAGQNNTVSIFERDRASGALKVLNATPCITEGGGTVGGLSCGTGRALDGPVAMDSVSNNTYVVTDGDDSVVTLTRESVGSAWKQRGADGNCITAGAPPANCKQGVGITNPASVTVAGGNVYVGASNSIAIFKPDSNGALSQSTTAADACVSSNGSGGSCATVPQITGPIVSMGVAKGGATLYAVDGTSLLQFARSTSGQLTFTRCYNDTGSNGCVNVTAPFVNPTSLFVNTSGKSVYVAAHGSNAIAVFGRTLSGANLGDLNGVALPGGCVSQGGAGGCISATTLTGVSKVWVHKSNRFAYAIAGDGLATFSRNSTTFVLTPLIPPAACTTETGDGITCKPAFGLAGASDILGTGTNHYYVTGQTNSTIAILKVNAT